LDKQFLKELSPEIKTCYVDFSFLGRANETSTKRIEGRKVVIDAKFDFLVDGKTHKEYRTKLLRLLGPAVFSRNTTKTIGLTFNLIGETENEVIELATTSFNLYDAASKVQKNLVNAEIPFRSKSKIIGQLTVTTRMIQALQSAVSELENMKRSRVR
jgi:hypothetical protein